MERSKDKNVKRTSLIRLGGLAAILGGVIFAVNGSLVDPEEGERTLRVSIVVFLLSMMAVVVALHLLQREGERYGRTGALASATAFVGVALMAGGYILVDFIISLEGLGTLLFLVGALVATIGIIALGVVTLDTAMLPRWSGVALIAGNPLLGVFIIVIFYERNLLLGSWLVAVPWIVVGYAIFRASTRQTERPSRVR